MSYRKNIAWSTDFSYEYFRKILKVVKSNFELRLIFEAPFIQKFNGKSKLFLRHDIDIDINKALKMAEIENKFGIRATYMVMVNSPLYCVKDISSCRLLSRLKLLGHELGLHFDNNEGNNSSSLGSIEPKIYSACEQLESIIRSPVKSISFHRPLPQFLRGPLMVAGRVNAYAQELMVSYLSDSKGKWREGEPLPKLLNHDKHLLQLLIHPIWWGEKHMLAEDRLQNFFDASTQGQSCKYIKKFDVALLNTLSIKRSGIVRKEKNDKKWKI